MTLRPTRELVEGNRHAAAQKSRTLWANQQSLGRTAYTSARARNFPIGTGITEAAAKTIVGVRMKRAGARFTQHGGQTVMLFRAAALSGRFDSLHRELHATYRAKIAA
jgi:hypothetical protein